MVRSLQGKHPNYFEAVLQLREVTQQIVDFVEEELRRTEHPIAKVTELKNGLDYYLADNELTRALGKKLQQKFGGELKVTASLHTKKDDKEKYRVTVLFRYPGFSKGDDVTYEGEEWTVEIMGKEIHLRHSTTNKKQRVKWKDMKNVKKNSSLLLEHCP